VIRVRNPETAEVAKLFNNTQRDYLFAFANEVAAVCESVGVSAAEVIASCNRGYERSRIPMPGPVGGPCLEKDPYIMADTAESFGLHTGLTLAARQWNERLPAWTVQRVVSEWQALGRGVPKRVAVLGLAFKGRPETNDLRGTLARPIIAELRRAFPDAALVGYDPMVSEQDARQLDIDPMASAADALLGADIAVIQTNHEQFGRMRLHTIAEGMSRPAMIYDYWGQFVGRSPLLPPDVHYLALGEPRAIPDNGQPR
jgi:nucleotide sugar dehydrogenase